MSDLRIQEARRAWEARPGDVQAQGAYLLELLRAGQLAAERLELAAYCGDVPARIAAGRPARGCALHANFEVCIDCDPTLWIEGLPDLFSKEVCIRAAWLAAEEARIRLPSFGSRAARETLEALAEWLEDPTVERIEHALEVKDAHLVAEGIPEDENPWWGRPTTLLVIRPTEDLRGRPMRRLSDGFPESGWQFFLRLAFEHCAEAITDYGGRRVTDKEARRLAAPQLLDLVVTAQDGLIAWALEDVRG